MTMLRTIVLMMAAVALAACGSLPSLEELLPESSNKVDYKHSKTLPPLEVPPDLITTTAEDALLAPRGATSYATASSTVEEQPTKISTVLIGHEHIQIMRDGDKRWLQIRGEPGPIWPRVRDFWLDRGFLLNIEDPRIGIMETDWAENRADIPQGPIRNFLSKFMDSAYSAATRDKFRTRIEVGRDTGTTELYLIHRGAEEVAQGDNFVWQSRAADPELEAEMLTRLMVFLGVEDRRARLMLANSRDGKARAELIKSESGEALLILTEDFSRAWRRTGVALDRVGFTVEDRDRSRGMFFVRYIDPGKDAKKSDGWLSKLAFWSSDDEDDENYLISLAGDGQETKITVLDAKGKPYTGKTAGRILSLLHDELK